ncbi:hypothetical protein SAMN05421858_2055 [Haladaptatus litoreus]|uniref:Uncharacterized protein n=1 Tax=Haladaptatus litoreus TaxID=553468 RepID=A0A1N6ZJ55_9EURY|nr:hypothetical protein [Haladaptatus litoreus]SIR26930.1 hypothetical protein SAMN05421858_2055 [Haladaptatus litoreus]
MDGVNRRRFLELAAGTVGLAGTAHGATQGAFRFNRRMVFEDPDVLSDSYLNRIVLVTDKSEPDTGIPSVGGCGFDQPWPPEGVDVFQGLVVEWRNRDTARLFGTDRRVRAEKLVQRDLYVERRETPVEIGTPFVINNVVRCPDGLVGVEAGQIPGIRIETPSGNEEGAG